MEQWGWAWRQGCRRPNLETVMVRTVIGLALGAAMMLAAGCASTPNSPSKPSHPPGTPPPSASNLPPPTPPGKTPGPGMR